MAAIEKGNDIFLYGNPDEACFIPVDLIDSRMVKMALKKRIPLNCVLPEKRLQEFGVFEEGFVLEVLNHYPKFLTHIPTEFMKDKYVLECCDTLYENILMESNLDSISQETADRIFETFGIKTLDIIPSRLVSLEMCHNIKGKVKKIFFSYFLEKMPDHVKGKNGRLLPLRNKKTID